MFFSHAFDCLQARLLQYVDLCKKNIYKHEMSKGITCSFFKEIAQQCGNTSRVWDVWRSVTKCGGCSLKLDFKTLNNGSNVCFSYFMIDL